MLQTNRQTDRQTDRPFKEVRIKSDTQTDRHTDTKPYFRLRLVTGGNGCLWVVTGAYGCLRMFTSGYGWLRMVTGDSVFKVRPNITNRQTPHCHYI